MKQNYFEIISVLFHMYDVTMSETEINYFSHRRSSKIISKLFRQQWTCGKIFM